MRSENMQENLYVIGLDNTVFSKIAPKFYIFDIKFTKDAKIKAYVAMLEKKNNTPISFTRPLHMLLSKQDHQT